MIGQRSWTIALLLAALALPLVVRNEYFLHIMIMVLFYAVLASSLNLKTVAEGIEEEAIADKLREMNCDAGQGYLWSKPVPADAFVEYMRESKQVGKPS